jgi:hypothetical protein
MVRFSAQMQGNLCAGRHRFAAAGDGGAVSGEHAAVNFMTVTNGDVPVRARHGMALRTQHSARNPVVPEVRRLHA